MKNRLNDEAKKVNHCPVKMCQRGCRSKNLFPPKYTGQTEASASHLIIIKVEWAWHGWQSFCHIPHSTLPLSVATPFAICTFRCFHVFHHHYQQLFVHTAIPGTSTPSPPQQQQLRLQEVEAEEEDAAICGKSNK